MKAIHVLVTVIFSLLISYKGSSQVKSGEWRDHLPYSISSFLAEADNKIYCSTYQGGLFSVNKKDNSVQKYSRVNGLSDVTISIIGFSDATSTLVIGYDNCNIDLIKDDVIINIPDIKQKTIIGNKNIYSVMFLNNLAYLSTGIGIIVIDLDKKEIKDTYQFGDQGSQIKVNCTAFDGRYLIAATDLGIYRIDINSPNPVDYTFWEKLGLNNLPPTDSGTFTSVVFFGGKLMALYKDVISNKSVVINISDNSWTYWNDYSTWDYTKQLYIHNNYLHISHREKLLVYDESLSIIYNAAWIWPDFCLYDKNNTLWIADIYADGLIKSENGSYSSGYSPNGPRYRDVGELVYDNGRLWVAAGNTSSWFASRGMYLFEEEKWSSFNTGVIPETVLNIAEIAIDPNNPDHIFGGSISYGIIEYEKNKSVIHYGVEDGILEPITASDDPNDVRIAGMTYDNSGNLWISTNMATDPVYVIRPDGKWEHIKLKYPGFGSREFVGDIFVSTYGDIWLLVERKGILVFRENEDGSIVEEFITLKNSEGDLWVYSIAEDQEGDIWVGTNKGPMVFFDPVIDYDPETFISANQILIPREGEEARGGEITADPLLQYERINCIAVDGGNRKWFGTERSGAFLMSEDGKTQIHSFNFYNSPLFSDNVVSIAINKESGEVFFGTDKGIVSFRGQATEGKDDYNNVYVFPNPVRENYEGDIIITGLIENSEIKITDVSGNLVYATKSLGGQAVWNGKNFSGQKVHTGVYLVFCSNEDGSKTHVTKLLFIH